MEDKGCTGPVQLHWMKRSKHATPVKRTSACLQKNRV